MKYTPPPATLFVEHRRRLASRLLPQSLAVVTANDILPTNADGTLPFRQNSDLFYLTGVDQEETVLILYPDAFDQDKHRELLFLRETNDHIATWEGEKLTKARAAELTGIPEKNIHCSRSNASISTSTNTPAPTSPSKHAKPASPASAVTNSRSITSSDWPRTSPPCGRANPPQN
jgi:hypothetical protein